MNAIDAWKFEEIIASANSMDNIDEAGAALMELGRTLLCNKYSEGKCSGCPLNVSFCIELRRYVKNVIESTQE